MPPLSPLADVTTHNPPAPLSPHLQRPKPCPRVGQGSPERCQPGLSPAPPPRRGQWQRASSGQALKLLLLGRCQASRGGIRALLMQPGTGPCADTAAISAGTAGAASAPGARAVPPRPPPVPSLGFSPWGTRGFTKAVHHNSSFLPRAPHFPRLGRRWCRASVSPSWDPAPWRCNTEALTLLRPSLSTPGSTPTRQNPLFDPRLAPAASPGRILGGTALPKRL